MVDVGAGPLADSPSPAAVLPNSRQPVALWDAALGSLGFLENRFLKETDRTHQCLSLWTRWSGTSVQSGRRTAAPVLLIRNMTKIIIKGFGGVASESGVKRLVGKLKPAANRNLQLQ